MWIFFLINEQICSEQEKRFAQMSFIIGKPKDREMLYEHCVLGRFIHTVLLEHHRKLTLFSSPPHILTWFYLAFCPFFATIL
jgi:hypothetical protein